MPDDIENSNASDSVNGWNFQVCAGVFLFFEDLKKAKTLKIEGKKQDIEITTSDEERRIQVKCLSDVKNRTTVYGHYKEALESLKESSGEGVQLLYFSNIRDPFNTGEGSFYDYGTCFRFSELTAKAQKKIKHVLGDDFNYDSLSIQIVFYYGDDGGKRRFVEERIAKFLLKVGGNESYKSEVFDRLIVRGLANAADKTVRISKDKFLLNVAVPFLEENVDLPVYQKFAEAISFEESNNYFRAFLSKELSDFRLFQKITSDYSKSREKEDFCDFIKNRYKDYLSLVPSDVNSDIAEGAIKILLYRVLQKQILLNNINKEACL